MLTPPPAPESNDGGKPVSDIFPAGVAAIEHAMPPNSAPKGLVRCECHFQPSPRRVSSTETLGPTFDRSSWHSGVFGSDPLRRG